MSDDLWMVIFFVSLMVFVFAGIAWSNSYPKGAGWLAIAFMGVAGMGIASSQLPGWTQ